MPGDAFLCLAFVTHLDVWHFVVSKYHLSRHNVKAWGYIPISSLFDMPRCLTLKSVYVLLKLVETMSTDEHSDQLCWWWWWESKKKSTAQFYLHIFNTLALTYDTIKMAGHAYLAIAISGTMLI